MTIPFDSATAHAAAREAQRNWAETPLPKRLRILKRFRHLLVERQDDLIDACAELPYRQDSTDTLTAELLPLADAVRFLERDASRLLRPVRLGRRGRPFWLSGTSSVVLREPKGLVLILAPANYPLLLPGVQAVQALAAGNAVLLKPGRFGEPVQRLFCELLTKAGLDSPLLTLLPSDPASAREMNTLGIDHLTLTGSATTGQTVMGMLSETLTPSTMELSGCDAMFVLPSADLDLVAKTLQFGLRLNGSQTCMAPRRIFVQKNRVDELVKSLSPLVASIGSAPVAEPVAKRLHELVPQAIAAGASVVSGKPTTDTMTPLVLRDVPPDCELLKEDLFAPVVSLVSVDSPEEALTFDRECPYALGATVFGDRKEAEAFARRIDAGCVVVNDFLVPTVDPRLPFGGRHRSGFGVTRGAEGLLEMTNIKVVATRRNAFRPHLDTRHPTDHELLGGMFRLLHGRGLRERFAGLRQMGSAVRKRRRSDAEGET